MKKIMLAITVLAVVLSSSVYAIDGATLLELRSDILDESRVIKQLLVKSKEDVVFMNSMWDASIATLMQLDAYFNMLGLFNSIKKEAVTKEGIKYLADWLTTVKNTNTANIQNLNAIIPRSLQTDTQVHANNMINFYKELNRRIDGEMKGLEALSKTAVR